MEMAIGGRGKELLRKGLPPVVALIVCVFAGMMLLYSCSAYPPAAHAQAPARQTSYWVTNTFSNPAAGSQATISQAAISGGRHVLDCVGWSGSAVVAPALTSVTVNVRDGATGAGTVRQTWQFAVPAATGQSIPAFQVCGLHVVGSNNTAMTVEFSAGVANLSEAVNMGGYDTAVNQ